jgi:hypothetical protein
MVIRPLEALVDELPEPEWLGRTEATSKAGWSV